MNMKKFFSSYWKSTLVIIGILYLSFVPPSTFDSSPKLLHFDKIIHLVLYFVLAAVLIYDFWKNNSGKLPSNKFIFICILFPVLLGGTVEIFQELFFKPRSADWFDWLADGIGVLLAYLFLLPIIRRRRIK